ncbi:MAG: DUF2330 domain-containing protein [Sandaracinaceae bacterium]|nr:DUF2330 domain-containing protein [Sandaracinaceae bacterium]
MMRRAGGYLAVALALMAPGGASAFCGFYVSGAGGQLVNNATTVVMMREGTRTVLSMQNNYQGPPQNFAMVVPVPVVLQQEHVRTLARDVFGRVDALAAPKLVEYWEQNPCPPPPPPVRRYARGAGMAMPAMAAMDRAEARERDLGVRIEAQFEVGEYEIVILSAQDSNGLETWLRREQYNIPQGASSALAPYVQSGMKFFVARVNVERVQFQNGQVMLSPLRFHYDTETFALPVRLGLLNSSGTQDLIVHVLARGTRYEVANYRNAFIPTNVNVADRVRNGFGEFYAALLDKTLEMNRGAVITEYAWEGAIPEFPQSASSCDPCPPEPPRPAADLITLGLDVLPSYRPDFVPGAHGSGMGRPFVLTRLHYRYGPDGLRDDLVFREAPPVVGGREQHFGRSSYLGQQSRGERGARVSAEPSNHFQARYAIRHWWPGPITCEHPIRGVWGGPPSGVAHRGATPATNSAFARRGARLESLIRQPIPELRVQPAASPSTGTSGGTRKASGKRDAPASAALGLLPVAGLLLLGLRRLSRRR